MARSQVIIAAPAEAVFAYLADFRRHGEWATHSGLTVESETPGPTAVGSRFRSHGHQLGRDLDDVLTVTEYEPPKRLSFESRGRFGIWRHSFTLTSSGSGATRVAKSMDRLDPPLVLRPLFALFLPFRLRQDLEGVRRRVEGGML